MRVDPTRPHVILSRRSERRTVKDLPDPGTAHRSSRHFAADFALTLAFLTLATLAALPARAQSDEPPPPPPAQSNEVAPRPGDTVEWYTVKENDTIFDLTAKYLGNSNLWPENVRLNPQVKDPRHLQPGSRIRLIVARVTPKAILNRVARKVEQKPDPNPWVAAQRGARLKEKDGVRTYEASSAELQFEDGSQLVMTENSLLFLKQMQQPKNKAARNDIEIIDGQVDLRSSATQKPANVQVVVGSVSIMNRATADKPLATRSRKASGDRAQVMVYGGSSEIASGGRTLRVAEGMGSEAAPGQPPAKPQKLLPAPVLDVPARGVSQRDVPFSWKPVPGAVAYTVEVFKDPHGSQLVARATGLRQTTWRAPKLPKDELYWRATAVAPSGLDGYPSKTNWIPASAPLPVLFQ